MNFLIFWFSTILLFFGFKTFANESSKTQIQAPKVIKVHDLRIIPREELKACPLVGKKFSQILEELKVVTAQYNTKCTSKALTTINNMSNNITTIDSYASQNEVDNINDEQVKAIQGALGGVSQLLADRQCRDEYVKGGFLPILADTVQSISQVALLVPNSTSLMVGIGGTLLSSTLTALNDLFTPDFVWESEKDRKAFLSFNCAFWSVRKKIDSQGIYNIKDHSLEFQVNELSTKIKDLTDKNKNSFPLTQKINELNQKKAAELASIQNKKEDALSKHLIGETRFQAEAKIQATLDTLNKDLISLVGEMPKVSQENIDAKKAQTITKLLSTISIANSRINILKPAASQFGNTIRFELAKEFFEKITPEIGMTLFKNDLAQMTIFSSEFSRHMIALKDISSDLQARLLAQLTPQEIKDIQNTVSSSEMIEKKYKNIISLFKDQNGKSYTTEEENYKSFVQMTSNLTKELAFLKSQLAPGGEDNYTINNDGTNDLQSIYELERKNIARIYGSVGYDYISFLIRKSKTEISNFNTNYEKLEGLGFIENYDFLIEEDKYKVCNNLTRMQRMYAGSNFPTEGAYDFALTNLDLFHGLNDSTLTFTNDRKKLRSQAFSALYSKALIAKYKDLKDKQISTIEDLTFAAKSLLYPVTKEECRRVRRSHIHKGVFSFKKICSEVSDRVIYDGSIGYEMIKNMIAREKVIKIQRLISHKCSKLIK